MIHYIVSKSVVVGNCLPTSINISQFMPLSRRFSCLGPSKYVCPSTVYVPELSGRIERELSLTHRIMSDQLCIQSERLLVIFDYLLHCILAISPIISRSRYTVTLTTASKFIVFFIV